MHGVQKGFAPKHCVGMIFIAPFLGAHSKTILNSNMFARITISAIGVGSIKKIPVGKIYSYAELARAIGKPSAFRTVAQANGANQLAIVIPCHSVINKTGALGAYGGGITRKEWLLQHETQGAL
jgi:O-6-methylguanine DNA methyltransferase